MSEHHHHHPKGQSHEQPRRGPDWRHAHHHWYFWIGVVLMLLAIGTYVMAEDLAWRPRSTRSQ